MDGHGASWIAAPTYNLAMEPDQSGSDRLLLHLSQALRLPILDSRGDRVGKVRDVVVRLHEEEYPRLSGFLADIGGRGVFLPLEQVASIDTEAVRLSKQKLDLRRFERREGEVLLRADVLGHRLIDVRTARFVRAHDVDLVMRDSQWMVTGVDTRSRHWLLGVLQRRSPEPPTADWKAFEPLIGYVPHRHGIGRLRRLGRLRPAQLADLLEEASQEEGQDLLEEVHEDPDLEADVFEELEPEHQLRLLESKDDAAVAEILARMAPDDAADLIVELDQDRRQQVLELLPEPTRRKVRRLLGYNPTSAGGLMSPDLVAVAEATTVEDALERVRVARDLPPEELSVVYLVGDDGVLSGSASLVQLVQAEPDARVGGVAERDPVCVNATADVAEVSLLMSDYDLSALPVVDDQGRLLGQISVDDVLEAILPDDWRRREQGIPASAPLGIPD
jgi:CBS domain-containing protein